MKRVVVFIFLLFFSFCYTCEKLPLLAIPPIDIPCVCCPVEGFRIDCIPPDILLSDDIERAIGELSQAQKDLIQKSKVARPVSVRINLFLKKMRDALRLDAEKCSELITLSLSRIDSLVAKLESKSCNVSTNTKCISEEVVDEFIPKIKEGIDEIKSIFSIDDDESGIPDVCRG